MGLLAPIVGRLYDRVGPRPLLPVGAVIISVALWAMTAVLSPDTPAFLIPIMHVLLFTGLAFTFTPLFSAGLGALRPDLYSHGAAILNTVQQVMGGAGTALFVTLMAATAAGPLAAGASVPVANAAGVHMAFMAGGGISLAGIVFISSREMLMLPMVGVGIAWASILTMPYAILAGALPASRMGYYMGLFNFFVVIPQIVSGLLLGFFTKHFFGGHTVLTLMLGGACMVLAAVLTLFVTDKAEK
jgi:maltose/moltooligosaccharide transporter